MQGLAIRTNRDSGTAFLRSAKISSGWSEMGVGSAMNLMIYSRCSWQRESRKKKYDTHDCVGIYRDPELAIIADWINYDCVHASDVQSSANSHRQYPLAFDPILTG